MSELPDDLYHALNDLADAGLAKKGPPVFLHATRKTGHPIVYDMDRLHAKVAKLKLPVTRIQIADWKREVLDARKISIDSGYARGIPESRAYIPAVIVPIKDPAEDSPYDWVVDGNHRIYRAMLRNEPRFPAHLVPFEVAQSCLFPEDKARMMHHICCCEGSARDIKSGLDRP